MNKIKITLIILIFIAAVAQVVILNRDSTAGENLVKIGSEIDQVDKENQRLSQQIASASALITISQKAKELGFVSSNKIVSLASPPKLAFSNEANY